MYYASYIHATAVLYISEIVVSNFFNTKIIQREDQKKNVPIESPLHTLKSFDINANIRFKMIK